MIIEYPRENARSLAPMFSEHRFLTSIIESAISTPLGQFWVDDMKNPTIALIGIGFQFLAGDHNSDGVDDLLEKIPPGHMTLVSNEGWANRLQQKWGRTIQTYQRFGFSSEDLDMNRIRTLKSQVPANYSIRRIDLPIANELPELLAPTIRIYFGTPERFIEKGLGFGVFFDGQLVSSAVSALPFEKHFEIQVDTLDNPSFRRKGLATAVSAALIEYALQNGLTPEWDAANEPSKNLAIKLGYTHPMEYTGYRWKSLANDT